MNWKNDRCRRACRQDSQKSDCKVRIKQAGTHGIISDYHHSGSDIRLYQRLSRCSKLNSYHRIYQGAYLPFKLYYGLLSSISLPFSLPNI